MTEPVYPKDKDEALAFFTEVVKQSVEDTRKEKVAVTFSCVQCHKEASREKKIEWIPPNPPFVMLVPFCDECQRKVKEDLRIWEEHIREHGLTISGEDGKKIALIPPSKKQRYVA